MTRKVSPLVGPRLAGRPDECFYCNEKLGSDHKADCVLVRKRVRLRLVVEFTDRVPDHWTADSIDFWLNEGTRCSDNELDRLIAVYQRLKREGIWCSCHAPVSFEVVEDNSNQQ